MDADRFDSLTRSLPAAASRRGLLAGLASGLVAALPLVLSGEDAPAKKKKGKGKNKHKKTDNCKKKGWARCPADSLFGCCPPDVPLCCPEHDAQACCPTELPICCPYGCCPNRPTIQCGPDANTPCLLVGGG